MNTKKKKHDKTLENRAELDGTVQETSCGHCSSPFVFGMKDKYHEFSLDLVTVLKCLEFAEIEGAVPPLPSSWWLDISQHYGYEFWERFAPKNDTE